VAKEDHFAADAVSEMRLLLAKSSWPLCRNTRQSFRRYFPVFGGVSTVIVNQGRFAGLQDQVVRYVRACPPGAIMPLILAPTVWRSQLEFSLVFRHSFLDHSAAGRLLEAVEAGLERFAGPEAVPPLVSSQMPAAAEELAVSR